MKHNAIFSAMLAGLFLVGCSENSSLNSPASGPSGSLQKVHAKGASVASVFELDQVVVVEKTGESYHVFGMIKYEYTNEDGSYSFSIQPDILVENTDENKKLASSVAKSDLITGTISNGTSDRIIEYTNTYQLEGIPGGTLDIEFYLSDAVSVHSMNIYTDSFRVRAQQK